MHRLKILIVLDLLVGLFYLYNFFISRMHLVEPPLATPVVIIWGFGFTGTALSVLFSNSIKKVLPFAGKILPLIIWSLTLILQLLVPFIPLLEYLSNPSTKSLIDYSFDSIIGWYLF